MDAHLAALAAHDPARLKTSPAVRFTEDGAPLHLGDGLWSTNQGLEPFRLDFADPETGQAGALISELFKVEDHKIQRVVAVITNMPYRMPTGWGTAGR